MISCDFLLRWADFNYGLLYLIYFTIPTGPQKPHHWTKSWTFSGSTFFTPFLRDAVIAVDERYVRKQYVTRDTWPWWRHETRDRTEVMTSLIGVHVTCSLKRKTTYNCCSLESIYVHPKLTSSLRHLIYTQCCFRSKAVFSYAPKWNKCVLQ